MPIKDLQHQIISDIARVASELGEAPTRDHYLNVGKIPKRTIDKVFGSFAAAIQAAGLKPRQKPRAQKQFESKIDRHNEIENAHKKFKSEILPYIGKYEYKPKKGQKVLTIAASSDHHSVFLDHFCFEVFVDHCRRLQPDIIALVGDVFDFYEVSKYDKNPARVTKLQAEIDYGVNHIFKPLRKACPDSQIDFFIGNHEWRLYKYLSSQARALSSLRCLQFNKLFQLDDYKINLVARPSFLNPDKTKQNENFKIYGDCFVLSHGTSHSKFSADKELAKFKMSGASGHVHRHQRHTTTDLDGVKTWTSLGMMAKHNVGEEYIYDLIQWQQGYQISHIDLEKKRVVSEYVECNDGFALAGGVYYFEKERRKNK